jgi:hypothetical protein
MIDISDLHYKDQRLVTDLISRMREKHADEYETRKVIEWFWDDWRPRRENNANELWDRYYD